MFKVSQEAARKWLSGEGLPKQATCIHIAKKANISYEWLMTGRGEMSIDTHYDIPDKLKLHLQALQKLPDYAVDEVIRDALKTAELIEKATNEAHKPNGTK
jgi:transcriptional regulator with XRE-family HTH domain